MLPRNTLRRAARRAGSVEMEKLDDMSSLSLQPLRERAARLRAGRRPAPKNGPVSGSRLLRLWLPLLMTLLFGASAAAAMPLSRYEAQIHEAAVKLKALAEQAAADRPAEHAARTAATLEDVRRLVPVEETVEWEGGQVRVNNSWLAAELDAYDNMSPADPRRAGALARLSERLSALDEMLAELAAPGVSPAEGKQPGAAKGSQKEQEKTRLESILRRDEYVERPPQKSLWERFVEWLNRRFPGSGSLRPGQLSWLSFILLIVILSLAASAIGYAIWRLASLFGNRRTQLKLDKREARVVLGERVAPEQSAADLMREAEALAREGELRAAIRKAYVAALLELGDRKVITLAQHKTNHDYLRALREKRQLLGEMQKLTNSFENHWYGFQQATADDWTSFRAGYQRVMSNE